MCDSVQEAITDAEAVIIGLSDSDIIHEVITHGTDGQFFLDLAGIAKPELIKGEYQGICW